MNLELCRVVNSAISSQINKIHTSFPAKVVAVNGLDIDVQPVMLVKQGSGTRKLPMIHCVPFLTPSVGNFGIYFTPKVGDEVLILCTEIPYDDWMISGQECLCLSNRRFDISDAVAICGFSSEPNRYIPEHDLEIRTDKSSVVFSGEEVILNGGSDTIPKYQNVHTIFTEIFEVFATLGRTLSPESYKALQTLEAGKVKV